MKKTATIISYHVFGTKNTNAIDITYRAGYGGKIPTKYMVFIDNKWRRVYCRQYSNIGTLYVLIKDEQVSCRILASVLSRNVFRCNFGYSFLFGNG